MMVWKISFSNSKAFLILNSSEDVIREMNYLMGEMVWAKQAGEDIKLSLIEMSKQDYENLPEFGGW